MHPIEITRWLIRFSVVVYFLLLGYIVFFAGRRQDGQNFRKKMNVYPLSNKIELFNKIRVAGSGQYYFFWENIIGNILMFIPLPVMIILLSGKKIVGYRMLLLILSISVAIETLQYLCNIGFADVDDVLLNTLGGLAGMAVVPFFSRAYQQAYS